MAGSADNAQLCEAELEDVGGEERKQHQTLPPQPKPLENKCFLLFPDKGHRETELEDASGDEGEEHQNLETTLNRSLEERLPEGNVKVNNQECSITAERNGKGCMVRNLSKTNPEDNS